MPQWIPFVIIICVTLPLLVVVSLQAFKWWTWDREQKVYFDTKSPKLDPEYHVVQDPGVLSMTVTRKIFIRYRSLISVSFSIMLFAIIIASTVMMTQFM